MRPWLAVAALTLSGWLAGYLARRPGEPEFRLVLEASDGFAYAAFLCGPALLGMGAAAVLMPGEGRRRILGRLALAFAGLWMGLWLCLVAMAGNFCLADDDGCYATVGWQLIVLGSAFGSIAVSAGAADAWSRRVERELHTGQRPARE